MKVSKLIAALSVCPDDAEVFFDSDGYACDIDTIHFSREAIEPGEYWGDTIIEDMWDDIVNDRVFHDFSDEEIERYRTLIKNDAPMKSVILDI